MAVIMPLPTTLSPRVQPPTPKAGPERTMSSDEEEEMNNRLLDNFLESSCRRSTPTHLVLPAANNTAPFLNPSNAPILNFPLIVIKQILRYLLTSPSPLILQPDSTITASRNRTFVEPSVLQVCKVFHNVGLPILYGENTLTTSSPATSFDFDEHLLSLRGSKRQMITSVRLEIDWADELWAKFPLVARALGELKSLQKLQLHIVMTEKEEKKKQTSDGAALMIDKEANLNIELAYGGQKYPSGKNITTTTPLRTPTIDGRVKREGPVVADAMLKAEMKILKDLVTDLKRLKHFRLLGFRNEGFARCLEEHVRRDSHS